MITLSSTQRQHLRGLAHGRQPVVMIGHAGLSEAVLAEIGAALSAHELVKIKAASGDADTRRNWLDTICQATDAAPVQQIGRMLVVYRPAQPPRIVLPD